MKVNFEKKLYKNIHVSVTAHSADYTFGAIFTDMKSSLILWVYTVCFTIFKVDVAVYLPVVSRTLVNTLVKFIFASCANT